MQADLQQDEKFNYADKDKIMARYLALSDRATGPHSNGVHDVTHLIWPESSFPFFLTREPEELAKIVALHQAAHRADHRRGARGAAGRRLEGRARL